MWRWSKRRAPDDRDDARDVWGRRILTSLGEDLRHGIRLMLRYRVFSTFSILSLALGIGGTTAAFSLYDAVVLRKLPVHDPDTLVTFSIHQGERSRPNSFIPYPHSPRCAASTSRSTACSPWPRYRP